MSSAFPGCGALPPAEKVLTGPCGMNPQYSLLATAPGGDRNHRDTRDPRVQNVCLPLSSSQGAWRPYKHFPLPVKAMKRAMAATHPSDMPGLLLEGTRKSCLSQACPFVPPPRSGRQPLAPVLPGLRCPLTQPATVHRPLPSHTEPGGSSPGASLLSSASSPTMRSGLWLLPSSAFQA